MFVHFKQKIEKMAKDLLNRSASKHIKLAKTGIDASTGEYSPYFKKLMSYCFPTNMDKLFSNTKDASVITLAPPLIALSVSLIISFRFSLNSIS